MSKNDIIYLYSVYLEEWKYRDNKFWQLWLKMIYVSVIVNVIPFLYERFFKGLIPLIFFPILGIVVQFIFLYMLVAMHKRYIAIGNTLKRINDMFKKKYRREIVTGLFGKRMLYFVIYVSFFMMMILSIAVMVLMYRK